MVSDFESAPPNSHEVRVAGHFGEWLQGRLGPAGPVALVTLPCPRLAVHARWRPAADFTIDPGEPPTIATSAAERLLTALDQPHVGAFGFRAEMPPGGGAGASTAALTALARVTGAGVSAERLAAHCLEVEGAVDPLMCAAPDRLLWSSRTALSLRDLPPPPVAEIVGGFFGPPSQTDPRDLDFPDLTDLVAPWIAAASAGDLAAAAGLAALSAERTTVLRGPNPDPTSALARQLGALGHLRAHTGSARGLIFPPGRAPVEAERRLHDAGLTQIIRFSTGS